MSTPLETIIESHLTAWNLPEGSERDQLIGAIYSSEVTISEPEQASVGHDGMDGAISALQAAIPGAQITRSGPIQTAQDLTTYSWNLGPVGGPVIATGRDVLIVEDGQIVALYVLIDAPSA